MKEWMVPVYEANVSWGLGLTAGQLELLERYGEMLLETQGKLNVIGPATAEEVALHHLVDSLAGLPVVRGTEGEVVDVGSGGGLPGIVLKVGLPSRPVVLLEARRRKVEFLRAAVAELGLSGVEVRGGRAEELGRGEWRGIFGCAVVRAVGRLDLLVRYGLPLLQPGGRLVAWKGPRVTGELSAAQKAAGSRGGAVVALVPYTWEGLDQRYLAVVDKSAVP